jgi:hypothetical protein
VDARQVLTAEIVGAFSKHLRLITREEIWCRQIYAIKHEYKQGLEEDVQTCFITDLHFEKGKLKVTNEQNSEFEVDPASLAVTLLKGQLVIDYTDLKL